MSGADHEPCPRCGEDVEPVHREWEYGPDGRYCPECGRPLHETTVRPPGGGS